MKQKTLNIAIKPSPMPETKLTAIYNGVTNCYDIVVSLEKKCHSIERVLTWYHITIKFQNTSLGQEDANEQVSGAKWNLQHRKPDKAIERLQMIRNSLQDNPKKKKKFSTFLHILKTTLIL